MFAGKKKEKEEEGERKEEDQWDLPVDRSNGYHKATDRRRMLPERVGDGRISEGPV